MIELCEALRCPIGFTNESLFCFTDKYLDTKTRYLYFKKDIKLAIEGPKNYKPGLPYDVKVINKACCAFKVHTSVSGLLVQMIRLLLPAAAT